MSTTTQDRVDNTALREAFERSGRSSTSVAVAVWGSGVQGSGTSLDRALGIRPDSSHGKKIYRQTIAYDLAVKIAREIGVDPIDMGI